MRRIAMLTLLLTAVPVVLAAGDPFSAHWHDGKAELNGYNLTVSRYGQDRVSHAVMIYVTEPFSGSKRVKVDDPTKKPDDTFDALKLNLIRDFQTGIYDYNTMVSVFVRSENFKPVKVTFTSAEWCGHVYSELLFDATKVRSSFFSYFEDESATRVLPRPAGGVSEDNLFILLRGLRGDYLEPGQSKSVDYLPGVFFSRLSHTKLNWTKATISRRSSTEKVAVPAGEYDVIVYDVSIDERRGVFFVENAYPHRIIRWELAPDVKGELTGSKRLAYWRLNNDGGEQHLNDLGLPLAIR